jgi:hypothetical protein
MGTGKGSELEGETKRIRRLVREAIDRSPEHGRSLNRLTLGFDLDDESKNVDHLVNDGDLVDLAQASLELHYKPVVTPGMTSPRRNCSTWY